MDGTKRTDDDSWRSLGREGGGEGTGSDPQGKNLKTSGEPPSRPDHCWTLPPATGSRR